MSLAALHGLLDLCFTWSLLHPVKNQIHTQQKSTELLPDLTHDCSIMQKESKALLRHWRGLLTFALLSGVSWSWLVAGGLPLLCTLGMTYHHQRKEGRRKMSKLKCDGVIVHTHNPSTCEAEAGGSQAWTTQ